MIEIQKFELINKGTLIARFNCKMLKWGGLIIRDCTLFESGANTWVNLPSKQYEVEGKKKFFSYLAYEDRALDDKFKEMILKAASDYMEKNCKPLENKTSREDYEEPPF